MKILIAGATGLIGKELVAQCQEQTIEVHYLTTQKGNTLSEKGVRGFYWNPEKDQIDEAAFQGVTAIVNLAGASVNKRWTSSQKKAIMESRTQPPKLILTTLKRIPHSVTQYLSASGISVYPSSFDQLYREEEPQIAQTFLGEVVKEWEAAADEFSTLGISVAKVRTGIVLSNEGGALPKMVKPIKMGIGAPLGTGEQWQSWIHIKDIAAIYLFLLKRQLSGVFNAVSPNPVTNKKMTQIIAHHFDKSLWGPNVPAFLIRLLLGKMGSLALESQLVSSQKLVDAGYPFHFVNLENAIEDLL